MPVTSQAVSLIFCEGKTDSYDYALLNRLLTSSGPQVVPVGGKRGFKSFIDGRLSTFNIPPPYIAFRDRDFDLDPTDTATLLAFPGVQNIWTTYRACLENYLIDASLIQSFWQEKSVGPKWKHGAAPILEELQNKIELSAREISEYEAVRWALAKLKPAPRWPEIETTWLVGSGKLPDSFAYPDCLDHAKQLVESYISVTENVTIERLETLSQEYRSRFTSPDFYASSQYLTWFHGKDFLQSVFRKLGVQLDNYITWSIQHFDFMSCPDLVELKQKCENL